MCAGICIVWHFQWRGTGGQEPKRLGGERGTGKGREEAGLPKWQVPGVIKKKCATLCNFVAVKIAHRGGGTTKERGGNLGMGRGRFRPHAPAPNVSII